MNISESNTTLQEEGMLQVDFTSMAEKPTGVWAPGWYPTEIIEGFMKGNYQFLTETKDSKRGDSINMRLCLRLKNGDQERMDFYNFNYRPIDFDPERRETVERLKAEFKGQSGSWPNFKDEQRSSLAMRELGNLQAATGAPILVNSEGYIDTSAFIGKTAYAKVIINTETGYNEIKAFSKFPNGVEPKTRRGQKPQR